MVKPQLANIHRRRITKRIVVDVKAVENLNTGLASLMMRLGFSAIRASFLLNIRKLTLERLWTSQ